MSLEAKLRDTEDAVAAGAEEIDLVISREAFLSGDDTRVQHEIVAVKERAGDAHLEVILETAELGSFDHVRHASTLAMETGADFIKTFTGRAAAGALATVSVASAMRNPTGIAGCSPVGPAWSGSAGGPRPSSPCCFTRRGAASARAAAAAAAAPTCGQPQSQRHRGNSKERRPG